MKTFYFKCILILSIGIFSSATSIAQNVDVLAFKILPKVYIFDWNVHKNRCYKAVEIECMLTNLGNKDIIISLPVCNSTSHPYLLEFNQLQSSFFVSPLGSPFGCVIDSTRILPKESITFNVDLSDILSSNLDAEFNNNNRKRYQIRLKYDFDNIKEHLKEFNKQDVHSKQVGYFLNSFDHLKTAWTNEVEVIIALPKEARKIRKNKRKAKIKHQRNQHK